jgi:transcriptional regulator with XRE-family HTH domain
MTLKEIRRQRRLTESDLAARMGITRAGLCRIERGAPTTTNALQAYARALGLPFVSVAEAWEESGQPARVVAHSG